MLFHNEGFNFLDQAQRQSCTNVYSEMTSTQINSPTLLVTGIIEAEMFTKTYRGRINAVIVECVFTLRHEKACVRCVIRVWPCLHVPLVYLVSPDLLH